MFAITGATGQLGRLVIDQLLERIPADQIAALVRSPDKAADLAARGVVVRHADYDKPETLRISAIVTRIPAPRRALAMPRPMPLAPPGSASSPIPACCAPTPRH